MVKSIWESMSAGTYIKENNEDFFPPSAKGVFDDK